MNLLIVDWDCLIHCLLGELQFPDPLQMLPLHVARTAKRGHDLLGVELVCPRLESNDSISVLSPLDIPLLPIVSKCDFCGCQSWAAKRGHVRKKVELISSVLERNDAISLSQLSHREFAILRLSIVRDESSIGDGSHLETIRGRSGSHCVW
ncbi:hypothetical protein PENTCL1PPCAC_22744 [Pristionchus entomophagus]|uniref:Uncharacterized protein n=1 Tax=Pristionchus entomophagus TaxID=358040 RepID=A0AAV5U2W8_9BILA|nr:hypothetical protein PENTCL1PPCAC_22744 [Pristionchus entomophagus]